MLNNDIGQELSQISLTGTRALILLGLLIQEPRSLAEIKQEFIKFKVMEPSHSYDIIRIDLNTLRTMGCEISRADKRTNGKYVLLRHPFELDINKNEISLLKRAFNKIKENSNIEVLIKFDKLLKKLSGQVYDQQLKEQLIGISPLKKYSEKDINTLASDCRNKKTLLLKYHSPVSKSSSEKQITAEKLIFKNDKIYLYGYDHSIDENVTLNIKRILKIISRKDTDNYTQSNSVTIKFKLTNFGVSGLDESEKILSGDAKDGFIIEGEYHNNFVATQRILSFGSACTVLEPQNFKESIIALLKKMKEIYKNDQ